MIEIKIILQLVEDGTLYVNAKGYYFCGIRIYRKIINSYLPIDLANCYPENEQPKMGFSKK